MNTPVLVTIVTQDPYNKRDKSMKTISILGLTSVTGALFILLKLLHVIHWSWGWVLSPIWGGALILVGIAIGASVVTMLVQRRS